MSKEPRKPRIYKKDKPPQEGDLCWAIMTEDRALPLIAPCIIEGVYEDGQQVLVKSVEAEKIVYFDAKLIEDRRQVCSTAHIFETRAEACLWIDHEIWDWSNMNISNVLLALIKRARPHKILPLLIDFLDKQLGN